MKWIMEKKEEISNFFKEHSNFFIIIIYTVVLTLLYLLAKYKNIDNNIINYFTFNKECPLDFHNLLNIILTILSIFIGAIITVATVLISMCDKRIMRLIKRYTQQKYLISSIKIAIASGIFAVVTLSIISSELDFNIFFVRFLLLYISGATIILFIKNSVLPVSLILNILDDCFNENDSIIENPEFSIHKKNKKNQNK